MQDIFKESLDLNGKITDLAGKCTIISIDVNSAMKVHKESGKENYRFLAERYLELVEELAEYGIIQKEW